MRLSHLVKACLNLAPWPSRDEFASNRVQNSRANWLRLSAAKNIYGVTTGFGPMVAFQVPENLQAEHSLRLLRSLTCGQGDLCDPSIVRLTMALRAYTLDLGFSGVRLEIPDTLWAMAKHGITPTVPSIGSLGASGDLIPLAHIALFACGENSVPNSMTPRLLLENLGLTPLNPEPREALSMINGTSFTLANAAIACEHIRHSLFESERLCGALFSVLGASFEPLKPAIHEIRGHTGQIQSAANILKSVIEKPTGKVRDLQEPYSLRCAPQILGAARDVIEWAASILETEMNGVDDNPVVTKDDIIHGGNFMAQQIAFASDSLSSAAIQIGILIERQLTLLCTPHYSDLPMLLSSNPGPQSGFAGVQILCTALVAELKSLGGNHANASIPANLSNQDIVSMGSLAARRCLKISQHLEQIVACLSLALKQAAYLQNRTDIINVMKGISFVELLDDRPLHQEILTETHQLSILGGI